MTKARIKVWRILASYAEQKAKESEREGDQYCRWVFDMEREAFTVKADRLEANAKQLAKDRRT